MLDASGAFGRKAVTDKYGRKVKHKIKEDLSKFYDIEDDVDAGNSQAQPSQSRGAGKVAQKSKTDKKSDRSGKRGGRQAKAEKAALPSSDEEDFMLSDSDGENSDSMPAARKGPGKGKGDREGGRSGVTLDAVSSKLKDKDLRTAMMEWSSSSSDEDGSGHDEDEEELPDLDDLKLPVAAYMPTGDETRRLAIMDMDWARVKAVDLFSVLSSFCPSNGAIESVSIYPSAFGKERMEQEQREGPGAFLGTAVALDEGDEDADEGGADGDDDADGADNVDMAKLRKYESDKMKYYYAVATFDSVGIAELLALALYGCVLVCLSVCLSVCLHVRMCVCTYICICVCICIRVCVCVYICIYMHAYVYIFIFI